MTIIRVDSLRSSTALPTTDDSQVTGQTRLQLNTTNSYETVADTSSDLDPSQFDTGLLTDTQRLAVSARFDALPADDQIKVDDAVANFNAKLAGVASGTTSLDDAKAAYSAAVTTYAAASTAAVTSSSTSSTGSLTSSSSAQTGSDAVNDIMTFSINTVEANTQSIAEQVENALAVKQDIRETATELRDMITNWPDPQDTSTQTFTYTEYDSETGEATEKTVTLTKAEAEDLEEDLSGQLDTFSDLTDTLQYDLQNAYQSQQQMMSVLSEIMKSMHDTMKNTISNVRG